MKTVYVVYAKIPSRLWNKKMSCLVSDSREYKYDEELDYYVGIYAWTTNKKYIEFFKEYRKSAFQNNIYSIKKINFDKDDYRQFQAIHVQEEIVIAGFQTRKSSDYNLKELSFEKGGITFVRMVCTKQEHNECHEDRQAHIYEKLYRLLKFDYFAFKDKYENIFEEIGYATEFDIEHGGDDDDDYYDERCDLANYNSGFGLTTNGFSMKLDLYGNEMALLMNLYYEMFMGFDKHEVVHGMQGD